MRLTILLFDRFTALDVVGGYEVLARLPGVETSFAATECGVVAADTRRLGLIAYQRLADVKQTDILYVPGGPGVDAVMTDAEVLRCVAGLSEQAAWTVGICNGVCVLGAAGLLAGRRVTTSWDSRDRVAAFGAEVLTDRFVIDGDLLTSAGVSASVDGALALATELVGAPAAQLVQLGIEYYPAPPFGPSSVDAVPESSKEAVLRWRAEVEPKQLEMTTPWHTR